MAAQLEAHGTIEPPHAAQPEPTRSGAWARGTQRVMLRPRHADARCAVHLRWSMQGPAGAPLLIVQGGISADRAVGAAAGAHAWWGDMVGAGLALDTRRLRVLSVDWLDHTDVAGARAVDSSDQADVIAALLDAFGERRAHAFIGASYGAMVGLALAARHPARLRHLVAISGAHRAHPLSTALRNLQREIVRLAASTGEACAGLDLARRLAMTTYRSEREFAERCRAEPVFEQGRYRFAEEGWLAAAGARFASRFDPARFLALSESIDLHRVDASAVRVPTTLVGISTDRVVPLADLCELQRGCGAPATLHVLDSRYGHDAFLKETAAVGVLLRETLDAIGA
jgi:homoserine O-acetyltransferase/O-succinyltransferase